MRSAWLQRSRLAMASGFSSCCDSNTNFDPSKCIRLLRSNSQGRRQARIDVMQGTLKACEEFSYTLPDGKLVVWGDYKTVSAEVKKTTMHTGDNFQHKPSRERPCRITVVNRDCLEEAIRLKSKGYYPAVLNMASSKRPGGGYLTGAGAQEENLFRRTNYVQHLADPGKKFDPERSWSYRIPEFCCIYSTNVQILRASETEGYAFLPEPVPMSFLALSGYPSPKLTRDKQKLIPEVAEGMTRKIRIMLAAGLCHGHDSLVLSALGCGAFRNPPGHVAQLFKLALEETQFKDAYRHVSFAILDDHNARGEGNFKPFCSVFGAAEE